MSSNNDLLDIVFVSDFHASAPAPTACGGGRFSADDQFGAFVVELIATAGNDRRHIELVGLGDVFHFPDDVDNAADAVEAVDQIAQNHPQLIDGFRTVLSAGHRVVLVPGNHDADLHRPAVQARLRQLVGSTLRFEPWIYYRPGQVYAEHGSQYHDINRCTYQLEPFVNDAAGPLRPALSSLLGKSVLDTARAANGLWRCRSTRQQRNDYRHRTLPTLAQNHPIDHRTLMRLDRLGETSLRATARRLGRKSVSLARERLGVGVAPPRDAYLTASLDGLDAVLRSSGHSVPNLVFGHTHLARRTERNGATYLNCGTWSSTNETGAQPLPFVRVRNCKAQLLEWSGTSIAQQPNHADVAG